MVALTPNSAPIPPAAASLPPRVSGGGTPEPSTSDPAPHTPDPAPASAPSPLTPPAASFLSALLASNFDFASIAATLSAEQLLELIRSDDLQRHLHDLLAFTNTCLQLKQAQAKSAALTVLTEVARTTDDPIEKRRAASALLRAAAPAPGTPPLRGGSSPASPGSPLPAPSSSTLNPTPPTPHPSLSPGHILYHITRALSRNDTPVPDAGLTTLAAFLDREAKVDGAPIPADDPRSAVQALIQSPLDAIIPDFEGVDIEPPADEPEIDPALTRFQSRVFLDDDEGAAALIFTLTRSPDSRHPGCWLISAIDIVDDAKPP